MCQMSFTGQSTCLQVQALLLLIGFCNGQSGSRTGSGHRYGGGRGFAVLTNQDAGAEGEGEQQEVDQRIVILLLVLLAVAVVGLLWQWCSYCHKIVNPPVVQKMDPEEQRRELEARYRALQQRFREGQTTSTDSFNPEPPISALEAANTFTVPPSSGSGGGEVETVAWAISQPPPRSPPQPPSSNFHGAGQGGMSDTGEPLTTMASGDGQALNVIYPP